MPEPVAEAAVGEEHSCARTQSGAVYCWGARSHGATGAWNQDDVDAMNALPGINAVASLTRASSKPSRVVLPHRADRLLSLRHESCVGESSGLTASAGRWTCWGGVSPVVDEARLGTQPRVMRERTTEELLEEIRRRGPGRDYLPCSIHAAISGPSLADGCALLPSVICDPHNLRPNCAALEVPYEIERVHGISNVVGVSPGPEHACAWTAEGRLFCWGNNRSGQLGLHSGYDPSRPMRAQIPPLPWLP